ncbi:hypothetical protein JW848_00725 [Candidatus Bipolaricaulota bacterium]|nr:hypothetical protein [Candidatus Bipolaricaulota bacterium]
MRRATIARELVITAPNAPGILAEITDRLYQMGIAIVAVTVQVADGHAVIRLLTDNESYAVEALHGMQLPLEHREVVLVDLPNRRGFLGKLADALGRDGIDILDLYLTVARGATSALLVFTCSHNGKAVQLLRGH